MSSRLAVPKEAPVSESQEDEEAPTSQSRRKEQRNANQDLGLQGVCLVQNELNELIGERYEEKLKQATKAYNDAKDKFRLAANQA